jgi:2-amino-4-hydroxy-6-hydroxymethyldihydropteridine diphosphokinase
MNEVVLLLGSNLGNSKVIIEKACVKISQSIGNITVQSSLYLSEPWGFIHENYFLNKAILCQTRMNAAQILDGILNIEKELGRERLNNAKYSARTIDIDILFYNADIINLDNLQIPHPRLTERRFVLEPLNEIIPGFIHPEKKLSIQNLLNICTDKSFVKKL